MAASVGGGDRSGEAGNRVVGLMDPHQRRRLRADRAFEIVRVRAVGRSDLPQPGAGAVHDVGNAK